MIRNDFFHEFRDGALLNAYEDYLKWVESGIVPSEGVLAKGRDYYCNEYPAHGLLMLELNLLRECAIRWKRIVETNNT